MPKKQLSLCMDIGNTNAKAAIFDGDKIEGILRVDSRGNFTAKSLARKISDFSRGKDGAPRAFCMAAISSVVPRLTKKFEEAALSLCARRPFVIQPGSHPALPVSVPEGAAGEMGSDLFCDAMEAWARFGRACVVCDFGTALSFVAVDGSARVAGVAIAPGIETSLRALCASAARLSEAPLARPASSLGMSTAEAIQAGMFFGCAGQVRSLLSRMKKDLARKEGLRPSDIKTAATGGLSGALAPISRIFDEMDTALTLKGVMRAGRALARYNQSHARHP